MRNKTTKHKKHLKCQRCKKPSYSPDGFFAVYRDGFKKQNVCVDCALKLVERVR